jgi:peptide/nickel transport system permease protein
MALGPRATQFAVDNLRREMHFDENLPVRYFYWLKGAIIGDFGNSLITKRPVLRDIKEYLPATLEMAVAAGIMLVVFSILLGTLAAAFRDSVIDNGIRLLAYAGVAMPSFVLAVFFVLYFGFINPIIPVLGRIGRMPVPASITGFITIDSLLAGNFKAFGSALAHLFLPALALAAGPMFQEARIIRTSITDNMNRDYMLFVQSYGIPRPVIISKYMLKPSVLPAVSMMGIDIATLMGNAFMVETVFNWPGISRYGMTAMLNKDLNAISAVIIIFGAIFVITNIFVDILSVRLDPRIRREEI